MTEREREFDRWLLERPKSCAVEDLRREYRERFLTPEAVAMIEAFKFDRKHLARARRGGQRARRETSTSQSIESTSCDDQQSADACIRPPGMAGSRKRARPLGAKALQEKSGTFSGALVDKLERRRLKGEGQMTLRLEGK